MMRTVALTQRVVVDRHGERRDALDQRWASFLSAAGYIGIALPNQPELAISLLQSTAPCGLILTGGNDLTSLGGDAPERDATEAAVLKLARAQRMPVLGVCRGAEFIVHADGGTLARASHHAGTRHAVRTPDGSFDVGSFHDWMIGALPPNYTAWGHAPDGSIEAFRTDRENIVGVMWHPERECPFRSEDARMIKDLFK